MSGTPMLKKLSHLLARSAGSEPEPVVEAPLGVDEQVVEKIKRALKVAAAQFVQEPWAEVSWQPFFALLAIGKDGGPAAQLSPVALRLDPAFQEQAKQMQARAELLALGKVREAAAARTESTLLGVGLIMHLSPRRCPRTKEEADLLRTPMAFGGLSDLDLPEAEHPFPTMEGVAFVLDCFDSSGEPQRRVFVRARRVGQSFWAEDLSPPQEVSPSVVPLTEIPRLNPHERGTPLSPKGPFYD